MVRDEYKKNLSLYTPGVNHLDVLQRSIFLFQILLRSEWLKILDIIKIMCVIGLSFVFLANQFTKIFFVL